MGRGFNQASPSFFVPFQVKNLRLMWRLLLLLMVLTFINCRLWTICKKTFNFVTSYIV